ncbi:MAG: hypothetical protein IJQ53_03170 [Clostridia bacterium]|nr:hypothetical protein [Clostridia bacterium]
MKNAAFKRIFAVLALILILAAFAPASASADTGPKPSVTVRFKNLPEGECWATLLSEQPECGPFGAFEGEDYEKYYEDRVGGANKEHFDICKAFTGYKDADGYYFLQRCFRIDEAKEFVWSYMPPERFKILIYFPARGTFFTSGKTEKQTFHSYYDADLSGADITKGGVLEAVASYDLKTEAIGLAARIALTVIIEIAVAILFGFRHKKPLLLILGVNAVTQILFNIALNVLIGKTGFTGTLLIVLVLEAVIIAVEATVYCVYMKRLQAGYDNERYIIGYTAVANIASFVAGLAFALLFPALF